MLWHIGSRQSLSEVVGTHVILDCKWIITVFHTQYRYRPPPQSMLLITKHIKPDQKLDTTLNRGRERQPRTQDLSLGKTLAAAGHVPHQKFSARGGVGKVSNYINIIPVGYSLKT